MPNEPQFGNGMRVLEEIFPAAGILPYIWPTTRLRRLAGNDEERARHFNDLLNDDSIDLLIAARGGYGVTRLLDKLDFGALKKNGATLMGYSDTAALLIAAAHSGCTHLIHGPMVCSSFAAIHDNSSLLNLYANNLRQILLGKADSLIPPWATLDFIKHGHFAGKLFPCNMTMLESLIGTPFFSPDDLKGAILALEDIAVPAHAIDRTLRHFVNCGLLQRLSGLIFGSFLSCEDNRELPEILREYASFVQGPVAILPQFGHCIPSVTLPFQCVSGL